ncbi:MAG: hypothetical protein J6T45_06865 [Fibrobacterales bacterium]|nr:hypothetical protein [Fibrobacterales bacterium]
MSVSAGIGNTRHFVDPSIAPAALVENGAKSLSLFAEKVDITRMKAPSFRMIVVADGAWAYRRPSGPIVSLIGYLKD